MIFIVAIIGVFIYGTWHNKQMDLKILDSPAFSVGYFLGTTLSKSTGLEGHYTFKVRGETFGGGQTDGRYRKLGNKLFERSFPVIYNSKDPKQYQRILVFPSDFERFHLPYPDSLSWVTDLAGTD